MSAHVHRWLDGLTGIELGASAHNSFGLAGSWYVDNDDDPDSLYRRDDLAHGGVTQRVDRREDGETLHSFADSELGYVFSSHVFEHFANPLGALAAWVRVVRPGGLVYLIVPRRDAAASDVGRGLTTLEHLLADRDTGQTVATHDHAPPIGRPGGHYHVFTSGSLRAIVAAAEPRLVLVDLLDPDDQVGNGFALVYRVTKCE